MYRNIPLFALFSLLFTFCHTTKKVKTGQSSIQNIKIAQQSVGKNLGPCEPSIAINPINTKQILAGSVLNGLHISNDGGRTWVTKMHQSPFGVYGDPVLHADEKGNFYYAHLSDPEGTAWASKLLLDRIVIDKTTDGGHNFSSSFTGLAHPKDQDKQWICSDPKTGNLYCTWTEFDVYDSKKATDKSRILFSKSTDKTKTWSKPLIISELEGDCLDGDNTTEGAVPCVGPTGEVYVGWAYAENIYFDRSIDGGETWGKKDILAAHQPGGWEIEIPGVGRCNGMPVTACDISTGPHRGTIYINWCDKRNGESDADIWIAKSTDKGATWSAATRVNQDKTKTDQFFTWMTIDQSTGFVYIVYYDRSKYSDLQTDVVLATSKDGGITWSNQTISETPFTPSPNVFFGDYNDIDAVNGHIRPIWTRYDAGAGLSIWTALIEENNK